MSWQSIINERASQGLSVGDQYYNQTGGGGGSRAQWLGYAVASGARLGNAWRDAYGSMGHSQRMELQAGWGGTIGEQWYNKAGLGGLDRNSLMSEAVAKGYNLGSDWRQQWDRLGWEQRIDLWAQSGSVGAQYYNQAGLSGLVGEAEARKYAESKGYSLGNDWAVASQEEALAEFTRKSQEDMDRANQEFLVQMNRAKGLVATNDAESLKVKRKKKRKKGTTNTITGGKLSIGGDKVTGGDLSLGGASAGKTLGIG